MAGLVRWQITFSEVAPSVSSRPFPVHISGSASQCRFDASAAPLSHSIRFVWSLAREKPHALHVAAAHKGDRSSWDTLTFRMLRSTFNTSINVHRDHCSRVPAFPRAANVDRACHRATVVRRSFLHLDTAALLTKPH